MPTRREFMHASGAAALALATADGDEHSRLRRESSIAYNSRRGEGPTYLGRPARYWLGRLLNRNTVEYSPFEELNDSQRDQTYQAVAAFGEQVTPELWRMLLRRREDGRQGALQVLSRMGPVGESMLVSAASDPRGNLRADALAALARDFPTAPDLPALLLAALNDDVHEVRLSAANSLWFIPQAAKPILEQALRHPDPAVRRSGVEQILRIDPDRAYAESLLIPLLSDLDLEVRWAVVRSLFFHLPVYPGVVPRILELIHAGCLAAAGYLPFAGTSGVAEVLTLLDHSDVTLRAAAARAVAEYVCNGDAEPKRNARELSAAEIEQIVIACRQAAQDNDLAVREPVLRVLSTLEGRRSLYNAVT